MMRKILIVEDELLLAHSISKFLQKKDFEVVSIVSSYQDAVDILQKRKIDIVLIDIILNGGKTGVDLGHFIQEKIKIPFIYVTAQLDDYFINKAKSTNPSGYLTKPLKYIDLFTTLKMIDINDQNKVLKINWKKQIIEIPVDQILYISSDHVYLHIHTEHAKETYMIRETLINITTILDNPYFKIVHKSYLINLTKVKKWNSSTIHIGDIAVNLSRQKKAEVLSALKKIEHEKTRL